MRVADIVPHWRKRWASNETRGARHNAALNRNIGIIGETMELSSLQIEILKRARDILTDYFEKSPCGYEFICNTVDTVTESAVPGSRGIPSSVSTQKLEAARKSLINGISLALCGRPTLSGFLRSFVPGMSVRFDLSWREGQRIANLGRLAWLDRMIETGELE